MRPQQPKRRPLGASAFPAGRFRATRINQVWAIDFLFDATSDGRPLKVLAMCDEFTRESIGGDVSGSITADDVVEIVDQAKAVRGARSSSAATTVPSWWRRPSATAAA